MTDLIWILDDDASIRWVVERTLVRAGYRCQCFEHPDQVLSALQKQSPALLLSDIRMPGLSGLELLPELQQRYPKLPIIIITAHADLESAIEAHRKGAFDYLAKPFDLQVLLDLVQRALCHTAASPEPQPLHKSTQLIGESPALQTLFRAIGRLAQTHLSVLLSGESGTGKELVASALHHNSPRADQPFIPLNMAAIPQELIESELFGHAKGAFTGATRERPGRFQQAHRGTLFLDEIGDMPASAQTRLLRVLSTGEFFPVGGEQPVRVDVRIIAATHQDLASRVESGLFREDLYHRLNVINLRLPPLRERSDDIPLLSQHFLRQAALELEIPIKQLMPESLKLLQRGPWPGNVRQLENLCRRLSVMTCGQQIHPSDLPSELQTLSAAEPLIESWSALLQQEAQRLLAQNEPLLPNLLAQFEQQLIEAALDYSQGHKGEAAQRIGWGRNTLTRKLKEQAARQ